MAILMVDGWDGERQIGKTIGEIEERHVVRYRKAATYCLDKNVLDASCGCGYGTAILSTAAKSVLGVDKQIAIDYANKHWKQDNVRFMVYDLNSNSYLKLGMFDVIVSIETIEHLKCSITDTIIKFTHILKRDGILILSHPVNEPNNPPVSKFHIHFKLQPAVMTKIMKDIGYQIVEDYLQPGRWNHIPHHILIGKKLHG
jgi:2-polyprenyl-3-methyl-5-hydroxy-6-metoxy-1,4-benzoquinol methylase